MTTSCPDYVFPLAEPKYANKLNRDLRPFETALAGFSAQRATDLDALLAAATIPTIQMLFAGGQLTAEELVTYYLHRIQRYDIDQLNAVLTLNPDALAIARALDEERAAGRACGPMHGIPVLVKDNIATGDGMPATAGAYALRHWIPDRDAFLVRQLRQAGAIILGKTNLSEFANYTDPCTPNGFSTLGGQTQNPRGPFDPLGSSSGSAVAVAAHLANVAVGTETQGSIIMPAWANGVAGLKTSRGLVSRDYIVPLLEPQDVPGPMGRTVTDVAIALTAMSGVDANDPATQAAAGLVGMDFFTCCTREAAQSVRVGIGINSDGTAATEAEAIAAALESQGVPVVRIDAGEIEGMTETDIEAVLPYGFRDEFDLFAAALGDQFPVRSLAEVVAINREDPANRVPYGQRHLQGAVDSTMTAEEFAATVAQQRSQTRQDIRDLLARHEVDVVIISPNSQQYAAAGFPALAVPNGLDPAGKPRTVVFMGDYLSEPKLLAVGYAFEQAADSLTTRDVESLLS